MRHERNLTLVRKKRTRPFFAGYDDLKCFTVAIITVKFNIWNIPFLSQKYPKNVSKISHFYPIFYFCIAGVCNSFAMRPSKKAMRFVPDDEGGTNPFRGVCQVLKLAYLPIGRQSREADRQYPPDNYRAYVVHPE